MIRSLISKPSSFALLVGVSVFCLLYWFSSFGLSALINWWFYPAPPENVLVTITTSWYWRAFGFALYLIPGFLAGFFARRAGFMHGAIVGAFTLPTMALFFYVAGFWSAVSASSLLYGLVLGLVWCSLGGFVGELSASKVRRQ